nr:rhodanese-like domain-containing protein [uncultured Bdellovibrio sp.]
MANTIDVQELKQKISQNKTLTLVEALPSQYFNQGHLPNAQNLPLEVTDEEIRSFLPNPNTEIVTYCSGPKCPNSMKLALRLNSLGYQKVYAFEQGKEGWVKAGNHLIK